VTLPFVSEDELGRLYPPAYAPYDLPDRGFARMASLAIRRWQGFLALRTPPLGALRERAPGRVLDVGCGRGDLGETLVRAGWRVTGIDPSPEACAVAARRGIDARVGTPATLDLEPGAYDAVSFQHSLEHVSDPLAALRSVAAALRPGGLVLITVPNFGGWQARVFRSRWYHLDLPRHRTHFTAQGLETLLRRAGLEPVDTSTSTSGAGLPASVQYAVTGRCLFPAGLRLRLAVAACWPLWPFARILDALGGGDVLHVVARR
jgi:SAM-dependent methyltransferase